MFLTTISNVSSTQTVLDQGRCCKFEFVANNIMKILTLLSPNRKSKSKTENLVYLKNIWLILFSNKIILFSRLVTRHNCWQHIIYIWTFFLDILITLDLQAWLLLFYIRVSSVFVFVCISYFLLQYKSSTVFLFKLLLLTFL